VSGRDLREGETWTRAQSAKNLVILFAVRAALAATRPLSTHVLQTLGRAIGSVAYVLARRARAVALENIGRAFPKASPTAHRALARRTYAELGTHLGETVACFHGARPEPLRFADAERAVIDAALAEGRGVIFASAHLGPWERVALTLASTGVPLTVVARESYDSRLTAIYEKLRTARGIPMIFRGDRASAIRILRTLRAGRVLGIPMDLASRVVSVDAPFLGHVTATPVGPARIALRVGAAVVGSAARSPAGISVTMTRIATADLVASDAGERALTARINDELSKRILAYPEGWVWMHPRFATHADINPS
jgi:Kdo2-lipid IVA lauroyltransferase/acyltransferase